MIDFFKEALYYQNCYSFIDSEDKRWRNVRVVDNDSTLPAAVAAAAPVHHNCWVPLELAKKSLFLHHHGHWFFLLYPFQRPDPRFDQLGVGSGDWSSLDCVGAN